MGSEVLFIYDLSLPLNPFLLLGIATFGNTLGAVVNYWLGLKGEEFLEKKNFLNPQQLKQAEDFFNRYGGVSLLFSWIPIIGDPITFIAGVLRYDFKKFVILVALAKFGRYLFLLVGYFYFS